MDNINRFNSYTCGWRFGDTFSDPGFHTTLIRLGYPEWWNFDQVVQQLESLKRPTQFFVKKYASYNQGTNKILVVDFVDAELKNIVKNFYESIVYPADIVKPSWNLVNFHISCWEQVEERNKFKLGDILTAKSFFIKKEKQELIVHSFDV